MHPAAHRLCGRHGHVHPGDGEALPHMLGMYEALIDVKSDLKSLFTGYARDVVAQLGNTIRHLSMQFSTRIREGEGRRQRREGGFVGAPVSPPSSCRHAITGCC
uniref:Uncharacterized protein n=1 Tax=Oryza rufipogon TaxID=4529 RepID=A0A0E0QYY4_ORYRU